MSDVTQSNTGFIPFIAPSAAGLTPQGFDFGQIAQQIAGQVLPVLPGLVLGVLSAHPTIGAQLRSQSALLPGFPPQTSFGIGVNTPLGGAGFGLSGATPTPGFMPQGFDFNQIAQQIVGQLLPVLPGLILGVLSAHPTIGPQLRGQVTAPQAATPVGFAPQGFDINQLVQQIVKTATSLIPTLISSVLAAHPTLGPQLRAQSWSPQGFAAQSPPNFSVNTPLGGAGLGLPGSTPQAVTPQGLDFGQLTQQIVGQVIPVLPGLITSLLSANPVLSAQQQARGQTTH
jgi:hypothetical protein